MNQFIRQIQQAHYKQAQGEKGFSQIILLGIIAVLVLIGVSGFLAFTDKKVPPSEGTAQQDVYSEDVTSRIEPTSSSTQSTKPKTQPELKPKDSPQEPPAKVVSEPPVQLPPSTQPVSWSFDDRGSEWRVSGNPPACPTPLKMQSPVDVSLATGVLYPGQYRGSDYKTHGGFRFDNSTNAVTIKAPMDAYISRASRYIQDGEVQYLFFFIAPCGVLYRFDHLLTLAPKLQEIAESLLPPARPDDSRTTDISERRIMVKAGEIVATEIGFKTPQNVGVDFGVYDLRAPNMISKDQSWEKLHENAKEMTFYALCFIDVLLEVDASRLKTLPSGVEGKSSDYCK